jgi:hypothetical protein
VGGAGCQRVRCVPGATPGDTDSSDGGHDLLTAAGEGHQDEPAGSLLPGQTSRQGLSFQELARIVGFPDVRKG